MGVLFPNPKDVRFWHELYGRTDEEMNGRAFIPQGREVDVIGPIENVEEDPGLQGSDAPLPEASQPARSPSLRPEAPKTASPSIGDGSRKLSSSTSEISSRSAPVRADSNSLFASSSSDISLRPARLPSPSPQNSPNRARTKPPDFLSSSGVKSVWGKFSSNASAALSVVQDAYVGVAKDLRNTGSSEGEPSGKTAELRGRETLSAWGEELPSHSVPRMGSLSLSTNNPWAVSRAPHPSLEENPWGSVRSPTVAESVSRDRSYQVTSPLPMDPTVAHPMPRTASSLSTVGTNAMTPPVAGNKVMPPASSSSTDPLGVGLL